MARLTLSSDGTLGDHFPFLALGAALAGRGHQVRYAGPLYLRDHIERCGLEFRRCRPELDPETVREKPDSFDHWSAARGGRTAAPAPERDLFAHLRFDERVADLAAALEGADLLICSRLQIAGRTASDLAGIPWISVCVLPWLYPSAGTAAEKGILARESAGAWQPGATRLRDRIHAHRRDLGLRDVSGDPPGDLFEASRILLATSPVFGVPAPEPGRDLVQTGFWFHDPPGWEDLVPGKADREWVADQPLPPLFLSFSSQPLRDPGAVVDVHLEAAERLGRSLVVQSGWAELSSGRLRDAVRDGRALLLDPGPQDWWFSRAGAVINHGGIGTVARALRAGAPQLVVPYGNDQFYNARQVVGLGIGAAVNPHRADAAGLAAVLSRRVLVPGTRNAAAVLAETLRSERGLGRACEQIEAWLSR